jgi:hypothetical protein
MASIYFLYDNKLDATATSITASSAATGYPASNLQHAFRTKVWRTAGATAGTANLVIGFGSALATTAVALTGYSWTAAPGTLSVQFNTSDSWGSPAATETLTWAASPTINGNKATICKIFAARTYAYSRLNVVYSPGSTPTDWDLGRRFIGGYFQPSINYLVDWSENIIDPSVGSRTIGGQDHIDEAEKYREVDFSFYIDTQSQWESFQTMINAVGTSKDLFVAFDYTSEPDEMTMYGKFTRVPNMMRRGRGFQADFTFRESR